MESMYYKWNKNADYFEVSYKNNKHWERSGNMKKTGAFMLLYLIKEYLHQSEGFMLLLQTQQIYALLVYYTGDTEWGRQ